MERRLRSPHRADNLKPRPAVQLHATDPMTAAELEKLCSDWPGVTSGIKWEDDLVFSVAGKMFAVLCVRGPDRDRISFKVDPERFLELTDQPGIVPAHYMARAFWITIAEPERFGAERMRAFVLHSYELVRANLTKKMQATLLAQEGAAPASAKPKAGKRNVRKG
jgi:predicted DNA-binding protein (MmcQ/YjbR family)